MSKNLINSNQKLRVRRILAFTLQEALVVLVLLGVIATLTIPNIVNEYKKTLTINQLKEAYSILNNMVYQSYLDNGYPPLNQSISNSFFDKYFGPYIEISKYCGRANSSSELKNTGCFKYSPYKNKNSDTEYVKDKNGNELKKDMIYTLDGPPTTSGGYEPSTWHKVLLKNGMGLATWRLSNVQGHGLIFLVDIDGPNKGPSKVGADVFEFNYYSPLISGSQCKKTMIVPGASNVSNINSNCAVTRTNLKKQCKENGTYQGANWNGMGCSGLIILDGWKISNDYPWTYANRKT